MIQAEERYRGKWSEEIMKINERENEEREITGDGMVKKRDGGYK